MEEWILAEIWRIVCRRMKFKVPKVSALQQVSFYVKPETFQPTLVHNSLFKMIAITTYYERHDVRKEVWLFGKGDYRLKCLKCFSFARHYCAYTFIAPAANPVHHIQVRPYTFMKAYNYRLISWKCDQHADCQFASAKHEHQFTHVRCNSRTDHRGLP